MSGNVTQKAVGAHSPVYGLIVRLISIQAPLYGWLVVDITTTTTTTTTNTTTTTTNVKYLATISYIYIYRDVLKCGGYLIILMMMLTNRP